MSDEIKNEPMFTRMKYIGNGMMVPMDETDYSGINSTVTVGELLRHINAQCVKAARAKNMEEVRRLAEFSGSIEEALKFYES